MLTTQSPVEMPLLDCGLVTVREAATATRLSRSKLYSLMDARQLSYVKVGRSRRIPRAALAQLLERGLILACIG